MFANILINISSFEKLVSYRMLYLWMTLVITVGFSINGLMRINE